MIAYLAHPVGFDPDERKLNLDNVQKWFLELIHKTDLTINVPWFIYVSNLDESYRKRAMRDDLRILDTCDAIILTGGRISEGMATELALARQRGMRVLDLTSAGYSPDDHPEITAKLMEQLR
jgi:hypothetical protein